MTHIELTPSQRSMLNASAYEPTNPPYLLQIIIPLSSNITEASWRDAWERVVIAHPMLRMGYTNGNVWIAEPERSPEWVFEDFSHLTQDAYNKETKNRFSLERQAGFDFSEDSTKTLCRSLWIHPPSGGTPLWCLTIHHALIDGNAFGPLIAKTVKALNTSKTPADESLFLQRAQQVNNANWDDARSFFRRTHGTQALATDPSDRLPNQVKASTKTTDMHRVALVLDPELQQQIAAFKESNPNTLVHAAWSLVLSRTTDSDKVVFGVTRHCRGKRSEGLRDAIGPYSNVVPLCIDIPAEKSVSSWLMDTHNSWQALGPYENCPLRALRLASQTEETNNRGFETLVNVVRETPAAEVEKILGENGVGQPTFHQKTDIPISLTISIEPELTGVLVSRHDCYSLSQTELLARLFIQSLRKIITHSTISVGKLSLQSSGHPYHAGHQVRYTETNVLALLENVVSANGNAVAIATPNQSLSFSELWHQSAIFASNLIEKKVIQEDVVAILTGRSIDTIIAMFGALRAGAAFFIINEELPKPRQIKNIREANSRFLVINSNMDNQLEDPLIDIVRINTVGAIKHSLNSSTAASTKDLAYLVATSGTTGNPNIVMIEHGGLLNLVQGYAAVLKPKLGDVRYQSVSASSDTFVLEVMLYLCSGATLHIEPGLLKTSLIQLDQSLQQRNISIIGLPSSLWREWAEQQMTKLPINQIKKTSSLRAVICSMERTDPKTLHRWKEHNGRDLLWINAYGPSEASCVASLFSIQANGTVPNGDIPIGRPLPNVSIYVLDSKQRLLPTGVIGEIAIGGTGLARGYMNNPDKSKEKFIANPFSSNIESRLYLTGDQGYFRDDGNLIFVGRSDNQVKIRGHRVELEEVELTLARHPEVKDAAAVVVIHCNANQLITFYSSNRKIDSSALRSHLLTELTAATIPHRFIHRDIIPRDRLGKVSRRQLTEEATKKVAATSTTNRDSYVWKESESLETRLSNLFGHILNIADFDEQDDFFLWGGDSLNAVTLLSELQKQSGYKLSINDLFQHPTPAKLAKHLQNNEQAHCLVSLSSGGKQPPLIFCHGYYGNLFSYLPLTKILKEDRPIWGLQAKERLGVPYDNTIEKMASRYAAAIIRQFGKSPCYICGYSLGGLIALETARQLSKQGYPIKRLIILDSFPSNLPTSTQLRMRTFYLRQRIKKALRKHHKLINPTQKWLSTLKQIIRYNNNTSQKIAKSENNLAKYYYSGLALKYHPKPLSIDVSFFMSKGGIRVPAAGWQYLSNKKARIITIPWQHHQIMQEEIASDLAKKFNTELTL